MTPATRSALRWGVIGAILVRLLVVLVSHGSNDAFIWQRIAENVRDLGLVDTYRTDEWAIHPPLPTAFFGGAAALSDSIGIPFPWLVKIPALVGDAVAAMAILAVWRRRGDERAAVTACLLYLWSPMTIALSAYHGNTDTLMAAFLLLAATLTPRRPMTSGLAFAAAVNVKLLPLLAGPALLAAGRDRRTGIRFLVGCTAATAPFVPLLLIDHSIVTDRILGYTSKPQGWGPSQYLSILTEGVGADPGTGAAATWYVDHGRWILAAALVVTAAIGWRRGLGALPLVTASIAAHFVVTPGMGVQHLALLSVIVPALDLRAARQLFALGGLYAIAIYGGYLETTFPFYSRFTEPAPGVVIAIGALLWCWIALLWWRCLFGPVDPASETLGTSATASSAPTGPVASSAARGSETQWIDGDAEPALGAFDRRERVGELVGSTGPGEPGRLDGAS